MVYVSAEERIGQSKTRQARIITGTHKKEIFFLGNATFASEPIILKKMLENTVVIVCAMMQDRD